MILKATRNPPLYDYTVDLTAPVPLPPYYNQSKYPFGFICTEERFPPNEGPDTCEFLLANLDEPQLFLDYLDQHPEYFL